MEKEVIRADLEEICRRSCVASRRAGGWCVRGETKFSYGNVEYLWQSNSILIVFKVSSLV